MLAQSGAEFWQLASGSPIEIVMAHLSLRLLVVLLGAGLLSSGALVFAARSADDTNSQPTPQQVEGKEKEDKKKIDEFAEAARLLPGPAGQPECVWLGHRAVNLIWRDDLDTAFRHLELYDRFGCPSGHVQETFRCVVRQGNIDPKAPESLNSRVHACWINPAVAPTTASTDPVLSKPPGSSNQ
jgi:hypothetical protein